MMPLEDQKILIELIPGAIIMIIFLWGLTCAALIKYLV